MQINVIGGYSESAKLIFIIAGDLKSCLHSQLELNNEFKCGPIDWYRNDGTA